jgi:zinc/manganese transport system substrate-binding protein
MGGMDRSPAWACPVATLLVVLSSALAGCTATASGTQGSSTSGKVLAVGAENEYANVMAQIGGRYVSVAAIMSDPNTDPHEFEASARVAVQVSRAELVVQNGVGYDSFMNKIEAASHVTGREVIVAQALLGVPASAFNPHLWYDPLTMPAVAKAVAEDLSRLEPAHAGYFAANLKRFEGSLMSWLQALARFKSAHRGTPVAVTEPVADYMLQAAGARILTSQSLQSAIMNGTDPSPQDISLETNLLSSHRVKVFLYNRQVTDSLTATFLADAQKAKIPVVGVYETMPTPGFDYQTWMMAELTALEHAVADRSSTATL